MGAAPVAGKRFIAIAGNIGAGKTELTRFLCRRYGIKPFFEPNEQNPYLADFYKDMKTWAYRSQPFNPGNAQSGETGQPGRRGP